MRKKFETEIKVGIFVAFGLVLTMIAIIGLGGTNTIFSRNNVYNSHFQSVEGLIEGAKVVLNGVQVGIVDKIRFDTKTKDVAVDYKINRSFEEWVREGSYAEIATQGVLGDKYINLTGGAADQPKLADGASIPVKSGQGINQFLSKGDQLLVTLNSIANSADRLLKSMEQGRRGDMIFEGMAVTAKNLSSASAKLNKELDDLQLKAAMKNLTEILKKVNNGNGTIGALINDPELYDSAKALVGGANRNRILRNLVRQTIKKSDEADAEQNKR